MTETIKFGPEWIRMLSDGGTGVSNAASDCNVNNDTNVSDDLDNTNNSSNINVSPPKTYPQSLYQLVFVLL